jgi:hypothetical protein
MLQQGLNARGALQAFGTLWEPAFYRLLKPMILTGLSDPLTRALLKVSRKLPATGPTIRQHLLLPVLAALPVTIEHPELGSAHAPAPPAALTGAVAVQSAVRGPAQGAIAAGTAGARMLAIARVCFHVKGSILKPNLAEFAKQVHAQVWLHSLRPLQSAHLHVLSPGPHGAKHLPSTAHPVAYTRAHEFLRRQTHGSVARPQVQHQHDEEGRQRRLVKVALDTLRDVDFGPYMLLHVAQEALLEYSGSDDAGLRKAAAAAAWRVTERQWRLLRCARAWLSCVSCCARDWRTQRTSAGAKLRW